MNRYDNARIGWRSSPCSGFKPARPQIHCCPWAKDANGGFSTFNARAGGIGTKPTFKSAWKVGPSLPFLAGGFFEWRNALENLQSTA